MNIADYVCEKGGEININWASLANLKRGIAVGTIDLAGFNEIFDPVLDYLLKQGVLTFSRENTWRIVTLGSDAGPKTSYGQDHMCFTREEDAREYRATFHKHTQYGVGVEQLVA